MNARFELNMDKSTFFRWVQAQDRRYDWVKGKAVIQEGGTRDHTRVGTEFIIQLRTQLGRDLWLVSGTDLAVDLGDQIRYPDVMVEKLVDDGKALSSDRPVILIEVLSPSSVATDFTIKPPRYMALPSLEAYIVASQDEPRCWIWQRDAAKPDRPFPAEPSVVHGASEKIELAALGVSIALADIYRGMFKS